MTESLMDIPVGQQEIAAMLGVQRGTVNQWLQRGLLPEPAGMLGGRHRWWWSSTIREWSSATGRDQRRTR